MMDVKAQKEATQQISAILDKLPSDEDRANLVANILQGVLATPDNALSVMLSAVLELTGIVVMIVNKTGVHLDSTSRAGADQRTHGLVKSVRAAASEAIAEFMKTVKGAGETTKEGYEAALKEDRLKVAPCPICESTGPGMCGHAGIVAGWGKGTPS